MNSSVISYFKNLRTWTLAFAALAVVGLIFSIVTIEIRSETANLSNISRQFQESVRDDALAGRYDRVFRQCQILEGLSKLTFLSVQVHGREICSLGAPMLPQTLRLEIHRPILFDVSQEASESNTAGDVYIQMSLAFLVITVLGIMSLIAIATLGGVAILNHIFNTMNRKVVDRLDYLKAHFLNRSRGAILESDFSEMKTLINEYNQMLQNTVEQEEQIRVQSQGMALVSLSKQVAHDIRSPLSALNMVIATFNDLPQQQRAIISNATHRINDIANDLLKRRKLHESAGHPLKAINGPKSNHPLQIEQLVIDLLAEKRLQYQEMKDIKFGADLKDCVGVFVAVDRIELQRTLSNLINNSVEALKTESGEIVVSVRTYQDAVQIMVRDNGCGIPPEILTRLGEAGVSHGKEGSESGSGLGIHYAKQTIEAFGGTIVLSSKVDVGTLVQITLPIAKLQASAASRLSPQATRSSVQPA